MTYFMNNSPTNYLTSSQPASQKFNEDISRSRNYEEQPRTYDDPSQKREQKPFQGSAEDYFRNRSTIFANIAARSNMSHYGTSSLAFNEREVYNKQNNKFDIISLKPKAVHDEIKIYPKLTLENRDAQYCRKMQKIKDEEMLNSSMRNSSMGRSAVYGKLEQDGKEVAGKHTFMPE